MGRRDLIRRERAKLAAVEARDAARSGPAAPLPAWLGTGGTVASSESTWVRSAPAQHDFDAAASTADAPTGARRGGAGPTDGRRYLRSRVLRCRELVRRRDEARAAVRALETEIAKEVERARAVGAPWTAIAQCLAITRQGARQRYGTGATHAHPMRTWSTDLR